MVSTPLCQGGFTNYRWEAEGGRGKGTTLTLNERGAPAVPGAPLTSPIAHPVSYIVGLFNPINPLNTSLNVPCGCPRNSASGPIKRTVPRPTCASAAATPPSR